MNGTVLGVLLSPHPVCVSPRIAGMAGLVNGDTDENHRLPFGSYLFPVRHLCAQPNIGMLG